MKTKSEAIIFGLSFPNTYEDTSFKDTNFKLIRITYNKKTFLMVYERNGYVCLNVKTDPEWRDFWRNAFPSVVPGWHQNKEHWNTIILDGSIPISDIHKMIKESYQLVADSPTIRIYEAVKSIPVGRVATYGQVAQLAGNSKMSRAVGNALHKNPDPDNIPCYRVVNSKGELAGAFAFGGINVQQKLLESDGVEVINGKVDLLKYGVVLTNQ